MQQASPAGAFAALPGQQLPFETGHHATVPAAEQDTTPNARIAASAFIANSITPDPLKRKRPGFHAAGPLGPRAWNGLGRIVRLRWVLRLARRDRDVRKMSEPS